MSGRKTPLALRNLLHNRRRLAVAIGGLGFAVLLMFTQTGFKNALFDSTVKVIDELDADILLVNRGQYALPAKQTFSRRRIYQARSCPGVADVYPLYIETFYAVFKPLGHQGHPIRVMGYELGDPVFLIPEVTDQDEALSRPGTALVDRKSKAKYRIPDRLEESPSETDAELTDRSIRLVGTFEMGTDFANDGNLIMSDANFAEFFPFRVPMGDPLSVVDLGLVKVEPGADVQAVKRRLSEALPDDVAVFAKQELVDAEIRFWSKSTPVGYIFATGTVMAFIVGVIICYQVIYSGIADLMSEYATLKAMGYRNRYFMSLVLQTALYLSVLSYIPGLLLSLLMYRWLADYTGLLMVLTFPRAALVYVLTLGMCVFSGCLAMRKLLAADPADLF